jgi:superoxide dismutase
MGGKVTFYPSDPSLQEKEVPMNTFFHKIVMVRERLRVLEQNINNHPKLDDEDRINLQQYITRAYGSLTTFNILFAYKEDHFKGSGKD